MPNCRYIVGVYLSDSFVFNIAHPLYLHSNEISEPLCQSLSNYSHCRHHLILSFVIASQESVGIILVDLPVFIGQLERVCCCISFALKRPPLHVKRLASLNRPFAAIFIEKVKNYHVFDIDYLIVSQRRVPAGLTPRNRILQIAHLDNGV